MQKKTRASHRFAFSCAGLLLALGLASFGLADEPSNAKPERNIPDWKKN